MKDQKQLPFEQLVRQYQRLVYTVCFQLTQDVSTAEDLTQDTFLSAYLHQASAPPGYERQWLCRIAANKAKDHLQSAYQRHTVLPGDEGMPPGRGPSSEETLLSREEGGALREMILSLREPYGSVCRLHLLEERSPEETALALGRPVKTVYTQIARGKQLLREQLERSGTHGTFST